MLPGATFPWKCEHPGNIHSGSRPIKCLYLRGQESAELHAGFPRLYTPANGRCLIKAFAISLACSVIPFCKQIKWENILALGNLVPKKTSQIITSLSCLEKS